MNESYRITPRNLGSLCLETRCDGCFYILSKLRFHAPFDHSGAAIFHDCQAMQEATVGYHLEKDGCLPKQFAPFCDCTSRAEFPKHWSKFGYEHKSGVWLYGVPDDIFWRKGGTLSVWDHKTAHPKAGKDPYLPQYQTQVNGYANIAEVGLELGQVTNLALMYWEVQHQDVIDNPAKHVKDGTFCATFIPKPLEVELDYSKIDKLLEEGKKIWKLRTPPKHNEKCVDGKKLDALFAIQADIEDQLTGEDRRFIAKCGYTQWALDTVQRRWADRRYALASVLLAVQSLGDDDPSSGQGGMAADWEFLD